MEASAAEALAEIRSGDRVFVQGAAGVPLTSVAALVARAAELRDVELVHLAAGRGDYVPVFLRSRPS